MQTDGLSGIERISMNEPFHHPLDNVYQNHSLLLLEAMIPYVDPALKLPLAMLIKLQEFRILIQVFNNPSRMEACGLNRGTGSSEELLTSLCKAMGFDFMEQINTLNNMQNMMNTMNAMNTMQNMQNSASFFSSDPLAGMGNPGAGTMTEQNPPEQWEETKADTGSEEEFHGFSTETKNDMIDAIRQILSEQEGEQHES